MKAEAVEFAGQAVNIVQAECIDWTELTVHSAPERVAWAGLVVAAGAVVKTEQAETIAAADVASSEAEEIFGGPW